MWTDNEVLQAATTIAKTTQTLIGKNIDLTSNGSKLTLYYTYTKGDETGLLIKIYFLNNLNAGNAKFQLVDWTGTAGVYTAAANSITLTATTNGYITLDISGVAGVRVEAAGSNNDGTPTGTLAAWYTIKE